MNVNPPTPPHPTPPNLQVGVFVSIVSTKIPFKGAGKEYIGDDVVEMVGAVKAAIQVRACVGPRAGGWAGGWFIAELKAIE